MGPNKTFHVIKNVHHVSDTCRHSGKAEKSASDNERVYMVLDGEITVTTDQGTAVLGPMDSVHIAPKEMRVVENRGNAVATMLVIVSNAKVAP